MRARDYLRGALLLEGRGARRITRRLAGRAGAGAITLAGIALSAQDETKHFKLIGTTGTGKSTVIRQLLATALRRGDRAVVADPNGSYLREFRQRSRGDVVLNPLEADCVRWNPFWEIQERHDVEQLASALICAGEGSSAREWRGYARIFVTAVIRRCYEIARRDPAELWRLLLIAPTHELRPLVTGTPAQPFLDPENARMFGSIRSITAAAIAALEYVQEQKQESFAVRRWVQRGQGVLFLPYRANQIAALRSIIATWLRLAIFEAMEGREADRRLWFIVDELDALGVIEGLKDALARLRKFGGRCVLGFQSIAQVSTLYGQGDAQTIVENCANTLILRCSSSEQGGTAQFASRLIGDREVIRRSRSRGKDQRVFGMEGLRRSSNVTEHHVTEPAVLASQLEQLPDLVGYVKTASSGAWLRVAISR